MSDKYMREIEEILEQAERSGIPDGAKTPKGKQSHRPRGFNPFNRLFHLTGLIRLSSGKIMLAGISLLLVAVLLNTVMPGRVHLLVWVGLVLFVIAYGLFFAKPVQYEKRWRGRLIENQTPLWDRIKRWLKKG